MLQSWSRLLQVLLLGMALQACGDPDRDPVLPDAAEAAEWFGSGTEARTTGNILELRGSIDDEFLRRGGSIWARSGPYFYLFTVQVQRLFLEYPDLAAVRVITTNRAGEELARATLHRAELSEFQWKEALGRAALAQTQGTTSPRRVEELIHYGEEHTEYRYAE